MTYQEKLDSALALIQNHNSVVGENNPGFIDPIKFEQCLKASGATSEEILKGLSYEDILQCMPDFSGIKPKPIAKEVAKIFRGKAETEIDDRRPISGKRAERMTLQELVEAFDPEEMDSPIAKRLSSISRNEPFIVYGSGRSVDVTTTLKLLKELKDGFPPRDFINVNDDIKEIYKIGELPENYADENPIYQGRPLRPDGSCDQTGRSWEGVSLEVKQLIYLAVKLREVELNVDKAHDLLDLALQPDAATTLRNRYKNAALKFKELSQTGSLPVLKISLANLKSSKSPFENGKKVNWTNRSVR